MTIPALDWFFAAALLLSMALGAWRGLVFELISLVGWVAALLLGRWFAGDVAALLPLGNVSDTLRHVLGFLLVFVATVMLGSFLAVVAKKLLTTVGLRPADRALGALFGVCRGALLLLLLAALVNLTPAKDSAPWQQSHGAQLALQALGQLKPMLSPELAPYLPT